MAYVGRETAFEKKGKRLSGLLDFRQYAFPLQLTGHQVNDVAVYSVGSRRFGSFTDRAPNHPAGTIGGPDVDRPVSNFLRVHESRVINIAIIGEKPLFALAISCFRLLRYISVYIMSIDNLGEPSGDDDPVEGVFRNGARDL